MEEGGEGNELFGGMSKAAMMVFHLISFGADGANTRLALNRNKLATGRIADRS